MKNPWHAKFEAEGAETVQAKLDKGLYTSKKARDEARTWLNTIPSTEELEREWRDRNRQHSIAIGPDQTSLQGREERPESPTCKPPSERTRLLDMLIDVDAAEHRTGEKNQPRGVLTKRSELPPPATWNFKEHGPEPLRAQEKRIRDLLKDHPNPLADPIWIGHQEMKRQAAERYREKKAKLEMRKKAAYSNRVTRRWWLIGIGVGIASMIVTATTDWKDLFSIWETITSVVS